MFAYIRTSWKTDILINRYRYGGNVLQPFQALEPFLEMHSLHLKLLFLSSISLFLRAKHSVDILPGGLETRTGSTPTMSMPTASTALSSLVGVPNPFQLSRGQRKRRKHTFLNNISHIACLRSTFWALEGT